MAAENSHKAVKVKDKEQTDSAQEKRNRNPTKLAPGSTLTLVVSVRSLCPPCAGARQILTCLLGHGAGPLLGVCSAALAAGWFPGRGAPADCACFL